MLRSSFFLGLGSTLASDWKNLNSSPQERAHDLIQEMSLEEKITMLHGIPNNYNGDVIYVGLVKGNERLGIPQLRLNDGYSCIIPLILSLFLILLDLRVIVMIYSPKPLQRGHQLLPWRAPGTLNPLRNGQKPWEMNFTEKVPMCILDQA